MPAGAKPRTRFGPIWKWSSIRRPLPAPAGHDAALQMQNAHDVRDHLVVAAQIAGRLHEIDVAADAGEILFERRRSMPLVGLRLLSSVL